MRSSRIPRWSTSLVVQRRMLLEVQLYVPQFAFSPFSSFIDHLLSPQYVLPPNSVVYTGCVGDDDLAQRLKAANEKEGLAEVYLVKKGEQTGACAVVRTGHHRYMLYSVLHCSTRFLTVVPVPFRSLVTTLRAAEKFDKAHLSTPEVSRLIDGAKYFYVEGYFLTHGLEATLEVAKKASDAGKVSTAAFSFRLSMAHMSVLSILIRCSPLTFRRLSYRNSSRFNSSRSSLIVTLSLVMRARLQPGRVP